MPTYMYIHHIHISVHAKVELRKKARNKIIISEKIRFFAADYDFKNGGAIIKKDVKKDERFDDA